MARAKKNAAARRTRGAPQSANGNSTPGVVLPAPSSPATDAAGSGLASSRRRRSLRFWLIAIGIVLVAILLIGAAWTWSTVRQTLPQTSGSISLPGLSSPVSVTRDKYGVPQIVAANRHDLYQAQGYVHAQDRLFQMFYFRTLGEGRLAEFLSPSARDADIFLRTVGLRRAAQEDLKVLSPAVLADLQAYSDGVNQFLHTHTGSMPIEFQMLGIKMEDWQPLDTLTFGKVMAWDLSTNWDGELITADVTAKLGATSAAQLFPGYPTSGPFTVPGANSGSKSPAVDGFEANVRPWIPSLEIDSLGSNNWVVDGSKSATGKPLLANDPHLAVQNPSIWYQIHLSTTDGKYDIAGFGFAGAPGVITGHNKNIAWGVTNTEGDVEDIFLENLDNQNHPGQYQTPDGWKSLTLITQTIKIKDAAPVTYAVRLTSHGPLLSDALRTISSTIGTSITQSFSLDWTAAKGGHLFEAVDNLQSASNWQEFRQALSKWSVPGQNFVYADQSGNIGYQMTGDQVIRKKGDGKLPVPGWTGEYDWSGFVPFDDLPRAYNPPDHFVATANNEPFGPQYQYPIQGTWAPPWRIDRIRQMLQAKPKLSVDDIRAMQMDTHSLMAQSVAPVFAALAPSDPKAQEAVKLLKGWDGNLSVDSTAASVYEVTLSNALSETYGSILGNSLLGEYLGGAASSALASFQDLVSKPNDPIWQTNPDPTLRTRNAVLTKSLIDASNSLRSQLGDDVTGWTWGKLHTMTANHPFGSQAVIGSMFNQQTLPFGGDSTTVSVGAFDLTAPFAMTDHQSYRMVIDTNNWSNSGAVFAGGESGQPFSSHWSDRLANWKNGVLDPMYYTQQEIDQNKEATLNLTP